MCPFLLWRSVSAAEECMPASTAPAATPSISPRRVITAIRFFFPSLTYPGRLAVFAETFHFLLVFAGVHGFPEAVVLPRVERATGGQFGQDSGFEVCTLPVGQGGFFEDEEAGVDPSVADDGLFGEAADPAVRVELDGSVLRAERDGGDGGKAAALLVKSEQGVKVDVSETISIGGEEAVADVVRAGADAVGGIGFGSGIEDGDFPLGKAAFEIVEQHLFAVAGGEHEFAEALARVNVHEVDEDGASVHRHHGFGIIFRERIDAGALAPAKNNHVDFV